MTFLEAAIEVLKHNNNQGMSSREIWNDIEFRNLKKVDKKTPWASLSTVLLYHSKDEYKYKNFFKIVSEKPNKYCLLDFNINHLGIEKDILEEIIEEENNPSKEKILLYSVTSKELNWKKISVYNDNDTIEYDITDCEEYTYIIEDKAHATIKIGKTKNDPEQRLAQLRTGNPSLTLLHVFPSVQFSESELHKRFNDFSKDLEWFFYTKGLKSFISDEFNKHNKIMISYNKKNEYNNMEMNMLNSI